jgi:hypothetical protein
VSRPDTGHPFGFYRSVIHADGHVRVTVNSADLVPQAQAYLDWLAALGFDVAAFRLDWLAPEDAVTRYVTGHGCRACRVILSCGCDPVFALQGACPHGGTKRARQAARTAGLNLSTAGVTS